MTGKAIYAGEPAVSNSEITEFGIKPYIDFCPCGCYFKSCYNNRFEVFLC